MRHINKLSRGVVIFRLFSSHVKNALGSLEYINRVAWLDNRVKSNLFLETINLNYKGSKLLGFSGEYFLEIYEGIRGILGSYIDSSGLTEVYSDFLLGIPEDSKDLIVYFGSYSSILRLKGPLSLVGLQYMPIAAIYFFINNADVTRWEDINLEDYGFSQESLDYLLWFLYFIISTGPHIAGVYTNIHYSKDSSLLSQKITSRYNYIVRLFERHLCCCESFNRISEIGYDVDRIDVVKQLGFYLSPYVSSADLSARFEYAGNYNFFNWYYLNFQYRYEGLNFIGDIVHLVMRGFFFVRYPVIYLNKSIRLYVFSRFRHG